MACSFESSLVLVFVDIFCLTKTSAGEGKVKWKGWANMKVIFSGTGI
jgi:hypothetical protein